MTNLYPIENDIIKLAVKIIPGSSKSEIKNVRDGRLRIRIAAVPEDNKANEELKSFLAKSLGCAKKDVLIVAGEKSRLKTISLPLCVKMNLDKLVNLTGGIQ